MADILESMAYIQNQGERGFERGQKTKLASLFGQAYNAPREQRQSLLGQMASVSPQAAFDAEKHFSSMDDMSREEMGRYAMAFDALPDDQKPQAYPAFAMQMQKMGLPAPVQWNPEYAPRIRQFAQAWGGAGATGGMVQSRFVGEDGQIYALMRDGSVSPLGIKADPNTQIMEAAGGIYSIDKRTAQAMPVQVGQPAQQPLQQGPIQYSTSDNQPIPQNEMAAFQAAVQQDARGQDANVAVGGQLPPPLNYTGGGQLQAAPPKVSPAEAMRLQLAQEAAARAARAETRAVRGNAPAGFRFKPDGTLEPIPGGPKPAGAAASEDERKAAAWLAQATNAFQNMSGVLKQDPEADNPGLIEAYSPIDELANRSRSATRQRYVQAAESLSEALLRAATGAGINEHEAKQKVDELTPKRGDSDAVKAQKMAAIPVYLAALKARAGRAAPQGEQAVQNGTPKRLKFNPATGRIE